MSDPAQKVEVIYDISVLGLESRWGSGRAGIFRHVQDMARALIDSRQCSLIFSAVGEGDSLDCVIDYLAGDSQFPGKSIARSKVGHAVQGVARAVNGRLETARNGTRLALKCLRKSLHVTFPQHFKGVDPKALRHADVFHSHVVASCRACSPEILGAKRLSRFFTVFDLIPILFPGLTGMNATHFENFRRNLDRIDREDFAVCNSNSVRNDLCNYRPDLDPRRMVVASPAASALFHPVSEKLEIDRVLDKYKIPGAPYVLSLCTLEPRKNLDHLIRSFRALAAQQRTGDLHLVLAGRLGWDYEPILREACAGLGVILPGRIADEDLAALYSGALVFVYPSLYEGFGLPVLEAMQCGTPVIASNTSSLPEVVGDAGPLLDPTDADALSQSILDLYANSELRASMARKSLDRAKNFTWENCAREIIRAYETALSRRSPVALGS